MADGRSLVICVDSEAVGVWHFENKGSAAAVWTMDEVAKMLEGFDLVNRTKHLFEGATITDVRASASFNWNKGDDLPPEMLLAFAG
jgi:hypothetical protein